MPQKKKLGAYIRYEQEKHARSLIMFCMYVRYIAGILNSRSNFAAKSKVRTRPNFLGGTVSWLLACKSNKYEVIAHSQNNSLDLFMGSFSDGNVDLLGKGKRIPCHMKHYFF